MVTYSSIGRLNNEIVLCRQCPRLVEFRESVATIKRKKFLDWDYWGKPVPGYGDPNPKLLLIGLAPAAHGGNRTGRVFTGDKSADFLMKCLYDVGLTNQPNSDSLNDGLILSQIYMTPVLKCVPPQDKPRSEELRNCSIYFESELRFFKDARCILALGRIAFDGCLRFFRSQFDLKMKDYPFTHGVIYPLTNGMTLIGAYHPSPRNVNTKRLTYEMMISILEKVKLLADR